MNKTLLLNRSDVVNLAEPDLLHDAMQAAFIAHSLGEKPPTKRVPAEAGNGTAMVLVPGCVKGIPAYSVKVHAKFPTHPPAISGWYAHYDLWAGPTEQV